MNNGFGSEVYFGMGNTAIVGITGSLVSFKLNKTADVKEVTNGKNDVQYIGISKRKKVANAEILIYGSGSHLITVNDIGDTVSITSGFVTTDVAGNWAITKPDLDFKPDDGAKMSVELTQWVKSDGSTFP